MRQAKRITSVDVVEPSLSGDPLLRDLDLPLRRVFHPLGFSIEVITNSQQVLDAAEESWCASSEIFGQTGLQLRVALVQGGESVCPPAPVYRAYRNLLSVVADAGNCAVIDRDQGLAFIWINRSVIEHRRYLRYYFLEAVALSLLSSSYVTPLHAACVEFAGKGVLFCGNSGAGKSSLAFACARAGWTYISDDATYLVRNQKIRRVTGNSKQVRLRPSAAELFPDVKAFPAAQWVAGKPSLEIPTGQLPYVNTATHSTVEFIVFLNRMPSATSELRPFSSDLAMQWASQSPAATGDNDEERSASLRHLLQAQLWELRYSDLQGAVAYLEKEIDARGA